MGLLSVGPPMKAGAEHVRFTLNLFVAGRGMLRRQGGLTLRAGSLGVLSAYVWNTPSMVRSVAKSALHTARS